MDVTTALAYAIYSSSSSSPPSCLEACLARLRLTRPGRPPPYGDVRAKSMCFWESRRTTKEGTLTICFPTLHNYCVSLTMLTCYRYAPDVALPDEYSSMVYAFCQTNLENLRLQPSLQEIFNLEGQHVIESHAGLIEHTDAD